MFWSDGWILNNSSRPLRDRFPLLFSFVKDDKVSVQDFLSISDPATQFYLPLSQQAAEELEIMTQWLQNLQYDPSSKDIWCWPHKDGYTAKSFYSLMHSHLPDDIVCKWLWKSKCTMKTKVFGWLLLFDRLNTKDLLVRRHWRSPQEDNWCVLCHNNALEDRLHLFFSCLFSSRVWCYLQILWRQDGHLVNSLSQARQSFGHPFFLEVVLTAAWCIWTERNDKTFRNERPSFNSWRRHFVHDITLLSHRFQGDTRSRLLTWINNLQ